MAILTALGVGLFLADFGGYLTAALVGFLLLGGAGVPLVAWAMGRDPGKGLVNLRARRLLALDGRRNLDGLNSHDYR